MFSLARFLSLEMVGENRSWCLCGGWEREEGEGRETVEGWLPGPHNCHAPGGWSCFEKSPSMTEEEGESYIFAVLLSLIVGPL